MCEIMYNNIYDTAYNEQNAIIYGENENNINKFGGKNID